MRVLACDTGLATFGWALCDFTLTQASPPKVKIALLSCGALKTEPSAKKQKVLSVEDTARRLKEIADVLLAPGPMNDPCFPIRLVCVESLSIVRNAGSSAKMGAAWGAVHMFAFMQGIPVLRASPQAVHVVATGQKKATKAEVIAGMTRLHPELPELLMDVPEPLHEHAADALAVAHACKNDESVRIALAMQEMYPR